MRNFIIILVILIGVGVIYWGFLHQSPSEDIVMGLQKPQKGSPNYEPEQFPNEWSFRQRAYPYPQVKFESYQVAFEQTKRERSHYGSLRDPEWTFAGPTNIGGRITDIAVHPDHPDVIYIGAASGGVIKSTDGGETWQAIFDDVAVAPIGALAIDPEDPNTIYVGTGESNATDRGYFGLGMFKSTDAGVTWTSLGLEETRYFGRIVIDPEDTDRLFVAANGQLYGTNPERGIYRSVNGGEDWERVLFVSDSTAAIDVALHPENPNIVYAAMWERIRRLGAERRSGGLTSGIWRSTDGGDTWTELTNGLPQGSNVGRIGLSVTPANPDLVYAIYADDPGYFMGVYKSTNAGDTWSRVDTGGLGNVFSSYGWFFGNIRVSPSDPDLVFALGLTLHRSTNGGQTWQEIGSSQLHVDHHAMWIDPNTDEIVDGNDGGIYFSSNDGTSWQKSYDLPISQFYAIAIDYSNPHRLYGGTQDNGTLRTWDGSTDDWDHILGGDGFYCLVHPENSNRVYAESQFGNLRRSNNAGTTWQNALTGISSSDRVNWSVPVVMDPSDPDVMYYGTHRLYRSTNGAASWSPISGDLGVDGGLREDRYWGTITTIAVAPTDPNVIYVGTDNAHVWVTLNGGEEWTEISEGLPDRWVTRVAVDPNDPMIAYVTFSGYRWEEAQPHVFRTTNAGDSWQDIAGNLADAPVHVIIVDPEYPERLYIGTDFGVYYTNNLGNFWRPLGSNFPICPVLDLAIHNPTRKLVAGSHGRSMFTLNLDDIILATFAGTITDSETEVPISQARIYVEGMPFEAFSDAAGEYRLAVDPGTYTLRVERFGYEDFVSDEYTIGEEDTVQVDIQLESLPRRRMWGYVTSNRDGEPLVGAMLRFVDVPIEPLYTDSVGYYEVYLPNNHGYYLQVSAPFHLLTGLTFFMSDGDDIREDFELTFVQSFEETDGGFIPVDGFNEWEHGISQESGGPEFAYEGMNVWGTDLDGEYDPLRNYFLVTPSFELNPSENVQLIFSTWYQTNEGWDGGNVSISTDNGESWELINPNDGYPHQSVVGLGGRPGFSGDSDGWVGASFQLDDYVGERVQFRFRFGSTNSTDKGWFIDNFLVRGAVDFYTDVEDGVVEQPVHSPARYQLQQNYPNPFNPSTTIIYEIPQQDHVSLKIYDAAGRLVRTLVQKEQPAGTYSVEWDGSTSKGRAAPSGTYFYRLDAGDYHQTQRMILLR